MNSEYGIANSESGAYNSQQLKEPAQDFAEQLPRIEPTEPTDALKTFKVQLGFRMELVAAEPLLRNPVALDFDERGRMFVVEFPEYNEYASPRPHGHGCIRLLEDTNSDGKIDKSTVFLDKLSSPAAVCCYGGGVFVGVVPDVLFCKDTDGDGKADQIRKVLTGFARDEAGEAMLNSFRWGIDNRIHIATSLGGGNVRRADRDDAKPVNIRSMNLLLDPRGGDFEITSGGGQHGMSMDDWGRTFVCSNSEPANLMMYDARYLARNPLLSAPAAAINIAPQGKYTDLFRISRVEPWRVLRTRLRSMGIVKGSDEGGKPAGFFTAATGITVYRGDAWPEEYRGNLFVGEVSGNLIYRARLEPRGVGLLAHRADKNAEFVASTDNWFRPVQFANAPDGTLYVIDMYRELVEGAKFLPPEILKHMNVAGGVERGRIYRIVPEGFKQPTLPDLGAAATPTLVALLEHRNGWHRDCAARLLYERQDRAAIAPLRKLATESKTPLTRALALYGLDGLKAIDASDVLARLDDVDPRVREHALRLSERFPADAAIADKATHMVDDPDLMVRYQLAFSLGTFSKAQTRPALVRLALRDAAPRPQPLSPEGERGGGEGWFRLAVLSSVYEQVGTLFADLLNDAAFRSSAAGKTLLAELAAQAGAGNRQHDIAAAVRAIDLLPPADAALAQFLVSQLVVKLSAARKKELGEVLGGKSQAYLAELIDRSRKISLDETRPTSERAEAARTLGLGTFSENRSVLAQLMKLSQPPEVQLAALQTLTRFDDPKTANLILDAWPGMSPQVRATATETLFSRGPWITAFLDAIEARKVEPNQLDPARIRLLQSHPDVALRQRAVRLFAAVSVLGARDKVFAQYRKSLGMKADVRRGKEHFKMHCAACHKLEGVGATVGADLAAIRNRGLESVLLNIIDPNREVKPQFLTYVAELLDGRIISGMIAAESGNSITMRASDGMTFTILRRDIENLTSSGFSFMPEGLERGIDLQAMADLLAYLSVAEGTQ